MGYYINVEPDVNVFVEDLNPNACKTFVFLHGWPGSHELFEYQFDRLASLGYRCIGLDQRGFGKSDRPYHGNNYDRLSDDVRCVFDELGLENVVLVGHSTGGAIATRYVARHNAHGVAKLILCAAPVPSLIKRPYFPYGQSKESILNMIQETYRDRPRMLRAFGDTFFFQNVGSGISDWLFQLGLQAAGWSTALVEEAWLDEEGLFNDIGKIRIPTLILHGIHDKVVSFEIAEVQRKAIKNSRLVPFEYSGHAMFYDQMDKFNDELIRFIEE